MGNRSKMVHEYKSKAIALAKEDGFPASYLRCYGAVIKILDSLLSQHVTVRSIEFHATDILFFHSTKAEKSIFDGLLWEFDDRFE